MSKTPLHLKYRPNSFNQVYGGALAVKTFEKMLRQGSQVFLLTGPSGVGKTTLARIGCSTINCEMIEIDGATYTGVDEMRGIQQLLQYPPLDKAAWGIIVDECHRLTKQAWESLLKVIEEPPTWAHWFFCTTEPAKILNTIKTRVVRIDLKALTFDELSDLVGDIAKEEKIKLEPSVKDLIVTEAHGSPRQALINLGVCADVKNRRDAATILRSAQGSEPVIELCRYLTKGQLNWTEAMELVAAIDEEPESVRIIVTNWMTKVVMQATKEADICYFLKVLEAFSTSFYQSDKTAPIILAIGRIIFT